MRDLLMMFALIGVPFLTSCAVVGWTDWGFDAWLAASFGSMLLVALLIGAVA